MGGIVISGRYVAQSITSGSAFVITTANQAATTPGAPVAMNSGNAGFVYHLAIGPIALGNAYGSGNYGDGLYGSGASLAGQTGTAIAPSDWELSNWGELLVSCEAVLRRDALRVLRDGVRRDFDATRARDLVESRESPQL